MKKNQIIRNDATGETSTMLVSDEEKGGACQLYEVRLPPHRPSPPLHYHVDFIETVSVKEGKLDIYVDRDQKHLLLQPGASATAHIRQPHRFANDHNEPVIFNLKAARRAARRREIQSASCEVVGYSSITRLWKGSPSPGNNRPRVTT